MSARGVPVLVLALAAPARGADPAAGRPEPTPSTVPASAAAAPAPPAWPELVALSDLSGLAPTADGGLVAVVNRPVGGHTVGWLRRGDVGWVVARTLPLPGGRVWDAESVDVLPDGGLLVVDEDEGALHALRVGDAGLVLARTWTTGRPEVGDGGGVEGLSVWKTDADGALWVVTGSQVAPVLTLWRLPARGGAAIEVDSVRTARAGVPEAPGLDVEGDVLWALHGQAGGQEYNRTSTWALSERGIGRREGPTPLPAELFYPGGADDGWEGLAVLPCVGGARELVLARDSEEVGVPRLASVRVACGGPARR